MKLVVSSNGSYGSPSFTEEPLADVSANYHSSQCVQLSEPHGADMADAEF
jgi:hypothetical protein